MTLTKSLWTKLITIGLGATMALGVGLTASKVADEVHAADTTVVWADTSPLPGSLTAVNGDSNVKIMVSATNTYTAPIRVYADTTITISSFNSCTLKSVTYTASSTGNYVKNAQDATVSPSVTPSVNVKDVTWTFSTSPTTFTFKPSSQLEQIVFRLLMKIWAQSQLM